MDVTTFYALFSATCFTLLGLRWTVVQRHEEWLRNAEQRAVVGGVYLSFLLPALMGLFAQVGGTETPAIWRVSFVGIAVVGGRDHELPDQPVRDQDEQDQQDGLGLDRRDLQR